MASVEIKPDHLFQCKRCGDCCRGYGGTYVSEEELHAIAAYVEVSPQKFRRAHCTRSGSRYLIAQKNDGYCTFWDGLCAIHPVKPKMCRRWPFIESVIKDAANWHQMASMCPGIRTDFPDRAIRRCVSAVVAKENKSRNTDIRR